MLPSAPFPASAPVRLPLRLLAASAVAALLMTAWPGPHAWAQASVRPGEPVTLNFENADIEAVARAMATITGRNVIVDPRVRGTLNLVTERPVAARQAFDQFLAALRLQGFTVVESAGLYKVVPEADAKLQSGGVHVSQGAFPTAPRGGQIVTQIFRLHYENAANLVPTLRPLISPNNTINVNPATNALVITDYADNLARIAKIIAALDVAEASDVEVIPLHHAIASEMVPLLNRLLGETAAIASGAGNAAPGAAAAGQAFRTTILADARSNAVIVRAANAARIAQVRNLVARLDKPPAPGSSAEHANIHVVFLKNADATQMAQTLRAALAAGQLNANANNASGSSTPSTPNAPKANGSANAGLSSSASLGESAGVHFGQSQAASTGGLIQADPSTNSLIITAPDPLYRQLRAVIDRLDSRRAQVLIESMVVEVSAEKAAEFGIQWQGGIGRAGDANVGALGTNFRGNGSGANILDLALAAALGGASGASQSTRQAAAGALSNLGAGINLGVAHNYGGTYVLGLLARFLEGMSDVNVLSTPNILTLDNEEARILIGKNVPFVTGQYTSNNNAIGSVNPFQTIERQDVGISLRVKPQINENGTVKLAVVQEVSDLLSNSDKGPTTSKRLIETNILVEDGGIIVLGGLLEDRYLASQQKVPLLGDIPVVGNAFRSEQRSRSKVNLMVFLRPTVLYDASGSDALALERYDLMRASQHRAQPQQHLFMSSVNSAPALPTLPAAPALSEKETQARQKRTIAPLSVLTNEPEPPNPRHQPDVRKLRSGESDGWVD